jgi:hypothetical protein
MKQSKDFCILCEFLGGLFAALLTGVLFSLGYIVVKEIDKIG